MHDYGNGVNKKLVAFIPSSKITWVNEVQVYLTVESNKEYNTGN